MHSVEIRRLGLLDAMQYRTLRLEALQREPDAFGSTYDVESLRTMEDFEERLTTSIVIGAFLGAGIVGMVGLKQESGQKDRHKGFVWGMYVKPEARRAGIANALMETLIRLAREILEQMNLTVVQGNDAAFGLYRKFGFEVYGIERRALKTPSGYADETLMVRFLT